MFFTQILMFKYSLLFFKKKILMFFTQFFQSCACNLVDIPRQTKSANVFLPWSSDLQSNWHLNASAAAASIPKPASSKPGHWPRPATAPPHAPIFPTNSSIGTLCKYGLISILASELLVHALRISTSVCRKQHLPPVSGSSLCSTSVQEQPLCQQFAPVGCWCSCRVWVWQLEQHPWSQLPSQPSCRSCGHKYWIWWCFEFSLQGCSTVIVSSAGNFLNYTV